jgi:oxygen-dependent protoporphyrinogen oxidase
LVHDGGILPVPATAAEMVASPLLSVAGRLRLLKEPFVARGEPPPEESVMEFATRRFGAEMARRFIDPVVSAASAGDPEELAACHALPHLVALERRSGSILKGRMQAARRARREGRRRVSLPSWSCAGGLETLPRRLADGLGGGVHRGTPVVAVGRQGTGWLVSTASGQSIEGDALVVAIPATAFAGMTWKFDGGEQAREAVAAIPHASVATLGLGFRRDQVTHPLDGYGILTATADGAPLRSVVFASGLFDGRAPAGAVLLGVMVGGVDHAGLVGGADAELIRTATELLRPLLGIAGEPVFGVVDRWPEAFPQAVAGHQAILDAVAGLEARTPTLGVCGAWREGIGLGPVMRGAMMAAERALGESTVAA